MKITNLLNETPIDMTGDANDPTVYGHEQANPMSLKGRIVQARNQLKELADLAESDELVVWEKITRLSKGGMFMGLEQNLEQIRHGIEQLAAKRRQGGVASRGIDKNIGEQGVAEGTEQGIDNKYRRTARKMIQIYNTNPEIKAKVDASTEPLEAMVYTTGVIKNPDRLSGTTHMNKLMTELESIYYYGREQGVAEGYENSDEYHILRHQTKLDIDREITMPAAWTKIKEFDSYQEARNAYQEMKDKFPNEKFTVTSHSKKRRAERQKEWGLSESKGPCWTKYNQADVNEI